MTAPTDHPEQRPLRAIIVACTVWALVGALLFGGREPPVHWIVTWLLPDDALGIAHALATLLWVPVATLWPRWGVPLALPLAVWGAFVPSTQPASLLLAVLALVVTGGRPRWGWVVVVGALAAALTTAQPEPVVALVVLSVVGTVIRAEFRERSAGQRRLEEVAALHSTLRQEVRSQVARDLHDVVGHQLSVILMRILGHREVDDAAELRAMLGQAERAAGAGLDELRVLLDGLRAPSDAGDDLVDELGQAVGLDVSLAALVGTLRGHGFRVDAPTVPPDVALDPPVLTTCRRVLTEAVTNVIRYAQPGSPVTVRLGSSGDDVHIRVANTLARGAVPPGQGLSGGVGLRGLTERARLLGGGVSAGPEGDTWVLEASLPVRGATPSGGRRPDTWWGRARAAVATRPGRAVATATIPLTAWGVWDYGPVAVGAMAAAIPVLVLLLWRPRLGIACAVVLGAVLWPFPNAGPAMGGLFVYSLFVAGAWLPWPLALATLALMTGAMAIWASVRPDDPESMTVTFISTVVLVAFGLVARFVGHRVSARRKTLAEADASLEAVRAEEQGTLARELHDLVTRQLTLVSLQGMSYANSDDRDELHRALDRVEAATREALTDLRRLVGVLRADNVAYARA